MFQFGLNHSREMIALLEKTINLLLVSFIFWCGQKQEMKNSMQCRLSEVEISPI